MRKIYPILPWVVLWAVFFTFAMWFNRMVHSQGLVEIMGYDYRTFVWQFADLNWIFYTGARHPGLGMVMSPVVLLGQLFAKFNLFEEFLLAVYALIGVVNVWLVKSIAGWVGAIVFLCFGMLWILAAVPESFPIAMLSLLLVLKLGTKQSRNWVWMALFALCSAVTITNGLKVIIAYLIVKRLTKRQSLIFIVVCGMIAIAGASFFMIRMMRWNALHPEEQKTVWLALSQTAEWIPEGLTIKDRLIMGLWNFLVVPVQLLPMHITGIAAGLWALMIYGMATAGLWFNRHREVVKIMIGMLTVDVFIHLICGWGINEAWLFAPHWFYILPIGIGMLARRKRRTCENTTHL